MTVLVAERGLDAREIMLRVEDLRAAYLRTRRRKPAPLAGR
jgi:hypothetical protein